MKSLLDILKANTDSKLKVSRFIEALNLEQVHWSQKHYTLSPLFSGETVYYFISEI